MVAGSGTTARGIVVAFDGTPGSEIALDWAAAAARRQARPLTVLYCVDMAAVPLYPAYSPDDLPREIREGAQATLDRGVERARNFARPPEVDGAIVVGTTAAEVVLASKDAELVVIGSRGRGRFAAGILGSVSYAVAAHAFCPVVVVRGETVVHPDTGHPVVVGVDDSDASHRAVSRAAEMAAAAAAPLRIVHVGRLRSPEGWAYVEDTAAGTPHSHAVRERAQAILTRARDRVLATHPEVEVETEVLFGEPGHVLAPYGARACLLVVGSRGRGGFAGLMLGSVSHTVIHEATCPVMVVR
jgi:nucleotide-binding universal stress UspA family protein